MVKINNHSASSDCLNNAHDAINIHLKPGHGSNLLLPEFCSRDEPEQLCIFFAKPFFRNNIKSVCFAWLFAFQSFIQAFEDLHFTDTDDDRSIGSAFLVELLFFSYLFISGVKDEVISL